MVLILVFEVHSAYILLEYRLQITDYSKKKKSPVDGIFRHVTFHVMLSREQGAQSRFNILLEYSKNGIVGGQCNIE
jgi:hypothetical protein